MDKFDRIYALHTLFAHARVPVKKSTIEERLECAHATVERIIKEMRLYLNAPIKYDTNTKGYFYDKTVDAHYELPGLWFNSSELYGLFASYQLLSEVGPGILESHIAPIKDKLESLMHSKSMQKGDVAERVRILKMAARKPNPKHFSVVASALLMRKQLGIKYAGRDRNKITERTLSPQRLVHYRDNWYVDAWCHLRKQLRTFSIDRIEYSRMENSGAIEIEQAVLKEHYASAYGIFSGKPNKIAILKFSQGIAKWVAEEQWHPEQNGQFNLDNSYELQIPYRDARELIMDILKYGADVEVLKPESLRQQIREQSAQVSNMYK